MILVKIFQAGINLKEFSKELEEKVLQRFVDALADYAMQAMKEAAPKRTGRLVQSIQKHVGRLSAQVGTDVEYAIYVEFGTRPHEIRPVHARALRFEVDGRIVFAARVWHPGTIPHPFVHVAADETLNAAEEIWRNVWSEEVERE
ncbi:MAG: HK97 gp10 family phage protein [Archaeoglobaceae archaeon]